MSEREIIELQTKLFRTSELPFWVRLRALVRERGVNPDTSLLPVTFEDDVDFEFGIIVTHDRRIIQYGVRFSEASPSDAVLTEWNEFSYHGPIPYEFSCTAAFKILDECA